MTFLQNPQTVSTLVLVMLIAVAALLIATIRLSVDLHRTKSRLKIFMKGKDAISLEKTFATRFKSLDRMERQMEKNIEAIDMIKAAQSKTWAKYGIVKYDAFDDVGGKMSFALALLDKANSGIILNAIHSRDNCFLYLKEIVNGESYIILSEEEIQALKNAVTGGVDIVLGEGM